MIDSANTTAFHVKTTSMPSLPMGPFLPKRWRRINPVATGGITNGNVTTVSTIDLPGQFQRAKIQASASPGGKMQATLTSAAHTVNLTTCQSSAVILQIAC